MNPLRDKSWSPYAVGAGIGLLETAAMATVKRPLGITSAFEDAAQMAQGRGEDSDEPPAIDWEMALVAGVLAGSALSSLASGDREHPAVPDRWREHVGRSRATRFAAAAGGGALMMIGARLAKGCTSGHGISGSMQFAASSWLFNPIMGAVAAGVARALYGRSR